MHDPQPLPPSLATLFAPVFYAGGAALALGGGVLAMLARDASAAVMMMVIAGIGIVTSTTILHVHSLMRPPHNNPERK
jgi:hypothetical protein